MLKRTFLFPRENIVVKSVPVPAIHPPITGYLCTASLSTLDWWRGGGRQGSQKRGREHYRNHQQEAKIKGTVFIKKKIFNLNF